MPPPWLQAFLGCVLLFATCTKDVMVLLIQHFSQVSYRALIYSAKTCSYTLQELKTTGPIQPRHVLGLLVLLFKAHPPTERNFVRMETFQRASAGNEVNEFETIKFTKQFSAVFFLTTHVTSAASCTAVCQLSGFAFTSQAFVRQRLCPGW